VPAIRSTSGICRADHLARADAGLKHQPQDRLVASVAHVRAGACLEQRLELNIGQRLDHGRSSLGGLHPDQRVHVDLALLGQPDSRTGA
jgi:hypothetical protein